MSDSERIEQLKFHVSTGDLFPVISTVLGFLEETVGDCSTEFAKSIAGMEIGVIQTLRKDLDYLQNNYMIVPKS